MVQAEVAEAWAEQRAELLEGSGVTPHKLLGQLSDILNLK